MNGGDVLRFLLPSGPQRQVEELKKTGQEPKFVLNVGDNFYPGGLDTHCSNGDPNDAAFTRSQSGTRTPSPR